MSNRLLIFNRRYCPSGVRTNRALVYVRGAELEFNVKIYYQISNGRRIKPSINIPRVKVVNLWENDGWFAGKFRFISFVKNLSRFKKEVKVGGWVYQYGMMDYLSLNIYVVFIAILLLVCIYAKL